MRFIHAVALLAVSATPALAQREPEIVIPGRPDVPVIINGVDASWGIVEGEFGLFRPGHPVTVITRPLVVSMPVTVPGYFPSSGRRPGYGRLEIIPPPNRPKPPPLPGGSCCGGKYYGGNRAAVDGNVFARTKKVWNGSPGRCRPRRRDASNSR